MTTFWVFMKYSLASVLTIAAGFSFALTVFIFSDNINHKVLFSSTIIEESLRPTVAVAQLLPDTIQAIVPVEETDDDDGDCS